MAKIFFVLSFDCEPVLKAYLAHTAGLGEEQLQKPPFGHNLKSPGCCARRKRPRDRRAAECSQQFPPSDGDCHTLVPREVRKGNDTTSERAVLTARHPARAGRTPGDDRRGPPPPSTRILTGIAWPRARREAGTQPVSLNISLASFRKSHIVVSYYCLLMIISAALSATRLLHLRLQIWA
jgi:hypothetical protein